MLYIFIVILVAYLIYVFVDHSRKTKAQQAELDRIQKRLAEKEQESTDDD